MKHFLLFVLLVSIALFTSSCNHILKIEITIPLQLVPYYEWLLSFPGLGTQPEVHPPIEIFISANYGFATNN